MRHSELTSYRDFKYGGVDELLWPKSDRDAYDAILNDWKVQHEDWLKDVESKRVVVQAGGNCGMYPLLYSSYFDNVYTFEPDPLNFYCLTNNCQLDNVIKFNTALGSGGMVTLTNYEYYNIGTMETQVSSRGHIPSIRIDDLDLKYCDLIHFDLEGFEDDALIGAMDTIEKFSPIIILERGRGFREISPIGYTKIFDGRDKVYKRK